MKIVVRCDFCGGEIEKYPSKVHAHNFCSKECLAKYSSKTHNPAYYSNLKSYINQAKHMSSLNKKMNSERMTPEVREKIRNKRLGSGSGKNYEKTYGRHTHRVVAEHILGRTLLPGEVVHHIDGNKRNNKPSNLMVFSSQGDHARWHACLKKGVIPDDIQAICLSALCNSEDSGQ